MPIIAALKDVTKAYPGILACTQVSVEFTGGEIHALLGENGAGKSTLVKILAGVIRPDSGTVEIDRQAVHFSSPRAAKRAGVGVIHQAGSLIETLTVGENLRLAKYNSHSRREAELATSPALSSLTIAADRLVSDLSPSEKRLVEIHRLLKENIRLLVLDEPTATLSPQESNLLFLELRKLAASGYTIVVVSHKLPEIIAHSDRLTVLRKGKVVARMRAGEIAPDRLVELVTGNARATGITTPVVRDNQVTRVRQPLLGLHNVWTRRASAHEAPLQGVDLTLHKGEMIGIAGRPGSGVATVVKLLYSGLNNLIKGNLAWMDSAPRANHRRAVGLIPGDRLHGGVITSFTVAENLALRRRHLLGWKTTVKAGNQPLREFADELITDFNIQPPNSQNPAGALSGGNLQKTILAREIDYATDLLLAVNPTAGLDFAAARFVQDSLRTKADAGTCVVVFSDDLDEFVGIVDRVVVMSRGRAVSELSGTEITKEAIGLALAEVVTEAPPATLFHSGEEVVACSE